LLIFGHPIFFRKLLLHGELGLHHSIDILHELGRQRGRRKLIGRGRVLDIGVDGRRHCLSVLLFAFLFRILCFSFSVIIVNLFLVEFSNKLVELAGPVLAVLVLSL